MLLVFFQLQLDPSGLSVAVAVVFREHGDSLVALVVDIEPAWGLGDEPREQNDQGREEHLKVDRNLPADVALHRDGAADCPRCQNGSSEPEAVAVGGDDATEGRVSRLYHVNWASRGDDRDAETENESTDLELSKAGVVSGGAIDNSSEDDDPCSDLHAPFSTPGVGGRADEEESADTTNLVHGGVDGSPVAVVGSMEEVQELLVGGETTEDGTVEAVL